MIITLFQKNKSNKMKLILLIFTIFFTVGCEFQEEYYWKRDDGDKFILRYKFEGKKIKLLSTYIDSENVKSTAIIDYFDPCKIYDSNNWTCDGAVGLEWIVMRNGKLTWYYWDEVRTYKKSYKFFY